MAERESTDLLDVSSYEGGNMLNSEIFRTTDVRRQSANLVMREGKAFGQRYSLEQGPCRFGFHVPTDDEREEVIDIIETLELTESIHETLLLPKSGKKQNLSSVLEDGEKGYYLSRNPNNDGTANVFAPSESTPSMLQMAIRNAISVRGFRNRPVVPTTAWTKMGEDIPKFSRLPAGYQEVEYIESSGTQYIDSGVTLDTNDKMNGLDMYIKATHTGTGNFMGAYDGSTFATMEVPGGYVNMLRCFIGNSNSYTDRDVLHSDNVTYDEIEYIYSSSLATFIVNGTTYTQSRSGSNNTGTRPIFIFCRSNSSGYEQILSMKLDKCFIKIGGVLLRDFVPCYRKSDNVIGLYDLVNDKFYTNAGSGTFTKGRDILYGINSHTLRYYPFASNVADRAGQGATGTVRGTVTYSNNGIAVSGDSGYVTGMTNGIANRDTYTQIFRARYTSFPDSYGLLIGDSSNNNTNSSFAFETGGDGSGYFRIYNFIGSGDAIGGGQDTPRDTYFHLWVMTADHGSYKLYKDGELYLEGTTTGIINDKPNMNLGRSSHYGSQREGYGEVKDYIVEDIPRSAQKIKDFYNLMSANIVGQ